MIRTSCTLLLSILLLQVSAQTGKLYRGTINKTIKVTLYLEGLDIGTNADPIVGSYKYDNQHSYILLNGYRNDRGNVVLVEQESANFSGVFLGALHKKNFHGKWFSDDSKKAYLFELTEAVANEEQVKKFKQAIDAKASQFRSN
jgi:hypothetical protein